jgi:O-antigen/teichoic acid export membrane protein
MSLAHERFRTLVRGLPACVRGFLARPKGLLTRRKDGIGMTNWFGAGQSKHPVEVRRLFTTFGFLVARQGATAIIGLGFWVVTTHLFSPEAVGLSAAAASTAMLLAAFGALGVPLFLLAEIESIDPLQRRVVFTTGNAIAAFVVLILAVGTVALSPFLGTSLRIIGADPAMATLFVIGSVATMAGLTFDDAALGLHRGAAQLWRGAISSLLKLAFVAVLILISVRTGAGLISAWALGLVVAFFFCMPMLGLKQAPRERGTFGQRTELVRRYGILSLQHHVLQLSISAVSFIIPLIATLLISPSQVAYFSAAYLLASVMLIVPYLLAISLFAERSGDPGLLSRHVRRTLPLGLAFVGAIVLVVEIAAPMALRLFGPAYAANGTAALRILILTGPAYVIKDHYVSIRRAQHRMSHGAVIMGIGTGVEVVGSALGGAIWGLNGICLGWAVSATCVALFLVPAVLEVWRHPVPAPVEDPARPPELIHSGSNR